MQLGEGPLPSERLARAFGALSNPVRLILLRAVRSPKSLTEIEAKTTSVARTTNGRPQSLARQTVKEHLERLMEADMVVSRETQRSGRAIVEYVTNHQALYALSEELRELARLQPTVEPERTTVGTGSSHEPHRVPPRCLVLLKGIGEGRAFDLAPPSSGARRWVIGRKREADVPLDFDPFVSGENAYVVWEGGAYFVEDVADSRNGTRLNFDLLPKGTRHALQHGDIVGVGRSLLMFRA